MKRIKPALAALCLIAMPMFAGTSVSATTVINGDFSSGLSGYSVVRCAFFFCNPDTTGSAVISSNDGDNYLQLLAPSMIFGLGQIEVSQTVAVTADAPVLSFDAGFLESVFDPAAQTSDGIDDYFTLLIRDAGNNLYSLFTLDSSGAAIAALAPDPSALTINLLTSSIFGVNFEADLSAYAGQDVDLIFIVVSKPDSLVSTFGIDNIEFSPVPLPAGIVFLLSAVVSLIGLRRK